MKAIKSIINYIKVNVDKFNSNHKASTLLLVLISVIVISVIIG